MGEHCRILEHCYLSRSLGTVAIANVRSEIESTQGQLNYLNKQIAYSSLDITFYTPLASKDVGYSAGYKFGKAVGDGWKSLVDFFFGLIAAWPFILIIWIIYVLIKRWRKRRSARKATL